MKALRKDFWMEIRRNKARFISIFFIVALGVAFFSGIQASSPDMRFSGDAYYDESKLMDMKVMGTLGLTDADVEELKKIDGIMEAEGAWSTDAVCGVGEVPKVLHVESVNETVNKLKAKEGRLPEKSGELFLDSAFASAQGYEIGDKIELHQEEDSELLLREDFTVVGTGSTPLYISFDRGNSTLGSGEVNGFAYVMPEDFDREIFTQIYLRVKGAESVTSYTDAYDNLIDKVTEHVEGIEKERCQVRYDSVMADAQKELADAKQELADGKKEAEEELADALKELEDGEKEYKDGKKEYLKAKKDYKKAKQDIAEGKIELEDGKRELADAREELSDAREQLSDAKEQAADGWQQLNDAQTKLDAGWAELNENQAKLDDGKKQLKAGKKELNNGIKKIEEAKKSLTDGQKELDDGKVLIAQGKEQIAAARIDLETKKQQCSAGLEQVAQGEAALAENEAVIQAGEAAFAEAEAAFKAGEAAFAEGEAALEQERENLCGLQAQYDAAVESGAYTEEQLAAMKAEIDTYQQILDGKSAELEVKRAEIEAARTEIEAQRAQIEAGRAELEANRAKLAATRKELEEGLASIEEGFVQLDAQEKELLEKEAGLPAEQEKINAGWATLKEQEKALEPAKKEIKAKEKEIKSAQKKLDAAKAELNAGQAEIDANEATLIDADAEIASGEQELFEGEQKLSDGEREIRENEQKIADGEAELKDGAKELKKARKEVVKGRKELDDGWKEYEDGKKEAEEEIADGEQKIKDAEEEISEIEVPEWIVSDRHGLPEYSDYGDNADRIRNIGQVFPVIFFLVAALVSLTTMTRMVEEQRTQIGTMKALGYGKYAIASKYLNYAFLATVGGSILGILTGEKILPYIIINAYGIMYHNMASNLQIHYELKFALIASGAAIVCTIGATIFSCYRALMETPASLMRPPAPKEGKRVLIERITIIWKHLNFTWKSTLRNLFRYKKRLFMTIFGIAGSMALILVGFGIRDSITDIADRQYRDLQHYDGTIIADEDASDKECGELNKYLEDNGQMSRYTNIRLTKMSAPKGKSKLSVYTFVPENLENFREDVTLQNRKTKERYELTDEGAAICEKTASLLNLEVGDMLTLIDDHQEYQVKVAVITENYMGHYVYMTPTVYEQTFGEKPDYTSTVFTMKDEYKSELERTGNEILKFPAALSISYTESLSGQLNRMLGALDTVIVVLIVSAGMLAFVVLYNLNNINITERKRELATLKVLGFYDMEVSEYVFRENVFLTVIGVLAGAVFGIFLHRYIITTVEVDAVMFGRNVKPVSFLISGIITVGFSLIVNMFMHFKLKKIDMVESLKSVE